MDIYRIHNHIIERAKNRIKIKYDGMHVHHIIPKKLGGSNHKSNLVVLTIKEHRLIHLIRYKLYGSHVDGHAFNMLNYNFANQSPNVIVKASLETKAKQRSRKIGKKLSKEHRLAISKGNFGKNRHSPSLETREKYRIAKLGKPGNPHTPESKAKLKIANTGINSKQAKKIEVNGIIYSCIQEAADLLNVSRHNVKKIGKFV